MFSYIFLYICLTVFSHSLFHLDRGKAARRHGETCPPRARSARSTSPSKCTAPGPARPSFASSLRASWRGTRSAWPRTSREGVAASPVPTAHPFRTGGSGGLGPGTFLKSALFEKYSENAVSDPPQSRFQDAAINTSCDLSFETAH